MSTKQILWYCQKFACLQFKQFILNILSSTGQLMWEIIHTNKNCRMQAMWDSFKSVLIKTIKIGLVYIITMHDHSLKLWLAHAKGFSDNDIATHLIYHHSSWEYVVMICVYMFNVVYVYVMYVYVTEWRVWEHINLVTNRFVQVVAPRG